MSNSNYSEYRELKPLTYLQPPYKASWFDERLKNIGGSNPFGEPNYRVVWGMDERCFRGGNPQAIKYIGLSESDLGMPAWILEEWWSPERLGSKEDWEAYRYAWDDDEGTVDVLGEYPSRGLYFMFGGRPLINPDLSPMELNENLLSSIAALIKGKIDGTPQSQAKAWREINQKAARAQAERRERAQAQAAESWDRYQTHGERINRERKRAYSLPTQKPVGSDNFTQRGALFVPLSLAKNKVQ